MPKKRKVAKQAKAALIRPKTSPYASPPVTLHFGPNHQPYHVPDALLQNLEKLPLPDFRTGNIYLADVDADIGHVLIHFLHTGVYQTLDDNDTDGIEDVDNGFVRKEFQKAVLAFEAATKYGIPGLQELAQMEMERRGTDMNLHDAVRAIRESFIAGPANEHVWVRDYVSGKVRWTFEHHPGLFSRPEFLEGIESPTLIKLLAQTTINLYSEEVSKLRKEKLSGEKAALPESNEPSLGSGTPDLSQLSFGHDTAGSATWPTSAKKFGAFDDSVAAWDPRVLDLTQDVTPQANPLISTTFCSRKSKKAAILQRTKEQAETETNLQKPLQADTNHAFANDTNEQQKSIEEDFEDSRKGMVTSPTAGPAPPIIPSVLEAPSPVAAAEDVTDPWDFAGISTVKMKKKKNLLPPTSPPPLPQSPVPGPEAEHVHEVCPVGPFAGLSKLQRKKLRKTMREEAAAKQKEDAERKLRKENTEAAQAERLDGEDAAAAAPVASIDAEAEIYTETMWDDSLPHPPEPEPEPEVLIAERFVEDVSVAAEVAPIEREDVTVPSTTVPVGVEVPIKEDEDTWGDDWGVGVRLSKKKKKKKGLAHLGAPLKPELNMGSGLVEESSIKDAGALDSAAAAGPTSSGDDCPLRLVHLSESDRWKSCKRCELYIQRIAVKLHSAGLSDANGFKATHDSWRA